MSESGNVPSKKYQLLHWVSSYGQIPEHWHFKRLGDFFEERSEFSNDQGRYPLYSFTIEDGVTPKTDRYERSFLLRDGEQNEYKVVRRSDLIFNPMNIRFGAVDIYTEDKPVAVSAYYTIAAPVSQEVDLRFLRMYLKSPQMLDVYHRMAIGSLIEKRRVHWSMFQDLFIALPPVAEQKQIADFLCTWDRAIAIVEKSIKNNERQKKVLLNRLVEGKLRLTGFGPPAPAKGVPRNWKTISLGKVGRCITGLTYSPADVVDDGGLLVLRSSNIADNEIALDDNVYVTTPVPEESLTKRGDILVAVRNGSRNLIGKNAVIGDSAAGMAHGAFMTLYRSEENYYLSHLFQSEMFSRQVNRNLGATINSINISSMNKFKFPFPPKDERDAIASVLSAASREIAALRKYLICLRSEKSALLRQLLAGKQRVNVKDTAAPVAVNG